MSREERTTGDHDRSTADERVVAEERPGLEVLARRLLELLGRITGLESTYLTMVDWGKDLQHILYSLNTGDLVIPEGLQVEWSDTLCRRALDGGPTCTSDVLAIYPDSAAARELGMTTYVTVLAARPCVPTRVGHTIVAAGRTARARPGR